MARRGREASGAGEAGSATPPTGGLVRSLARRGAPLAGLVRMPANEPLSSCAHNVWPPEPGRKIGSHQVSGLVLRTPDSGCGRGDDESPSHGTIFALSI